MTGKTQLLNSKNNNKRKVVKKQKNQLANGSITINVNDTIIPKENKIKSNFKRNFWISFVLIVISFLILVPKPKMFMYGAKQEQSIFYVPAAPFNITEQYISVAKVYDRIDYSNRRLTLCPTKLKNAKCHIINDVEEKGLLISVYKFLDFYVDSKMNSKKVYKS